MINSWVAKKGDLRKKEFITTAIKIFTVKGYEKTSINDILKEMKITKGAFYYYFASKEALLNEIVNNLVDDIEITVQKIAARNDLSTFDKLERIFYATNQYRKNNQSAYLQLYELQKKDENAFIARKFLQKALAVTLEQMQVIINQGVAEGIFNTANPREAAELYIRLGSLCKEKVIDTLTNSSNSNDSKRQSEQIKGIITFYQETMERILGAKEGTLDFFQTENGIIDLVQFFDKDKQ